MAGFTTQEFNTQDILNVIQNHTEAGAGLEEAILAPIPETQTFPAAPPVNAGSSGDTDGPVLSKRPRRTVRDPARRAAMADQMMQFAGLGQHQAPPTPKTYTPMPKQFELETPRFGEVGPDELDEDILASWNQALAAAMVPITDTENYLHLQQPAKKGEAAKPEMDFRESQSCVTSRAESGLDAMDLADQSRDTMSNSQKRPRSPGNSAETDQQMPKQKLDDMMERLVNGANKGGQMEDIDQSIANLLMEGGGFENLDLGDAMMETLINGDVQGGSDSNTSAQAEMDAIQKAEMDALQKALVDERTKIETAQANTELMLQKTVLCQLLFQQQQAVQQAVMQQQMQQHMQYQLQQQMQQQAQISQQGENNDAASGLNGNQDAQSDESKEKAFFFCEYIPGQKAKRGRPRGPRTIYKSRGNAER